MQMIVKYVRMVALALGLSALAACGIVPKAEGGKLPSSGVAATTSSKHAKCSENEEVCYRFRTLRLQSDQNHALFKEHQLQLPWSTDGERQFRAQELGSIAWGEYVKGNLKAHKASGGMYFMFFGASEVALGNFYAYQVNGKNVTTWTKIEEVTGKISYPNLSRNGQSLGVPRIFRITAEGDDPVGTELLVPWSMLTGVTVVICSESEVVYPPRGSTARAGLELSPAVLEWLQARRSRRVLLPFFY